MASPKAAAPPRVSPTASTDTPPPPANPVTKRSETRAFNFTIRAFFPTTTEPTKFNLITAMTQLFRMMIKDEPSLVLRTPTNDQQLIIASTPLPAGKTEFQKYFNVSNNARNDKQKQAHVCIGCHVLSNRSLGNIKFNSTHNHFLAWIKQARIFVESDNLGTDRPTTVGYFTKIASDITHLTNF